MTGNIHGRLNRNLEGTSRLIKLDLYGFCSGGGERNRSNHCDFCKASGNGSMHCNSCNSSWDVYCFPSDFHTERHPGGTDEYKGAWIGTMVELLGGIETIRIMDCAELETSRIEERSEQLRKKK